MSAEPVSVVTMPIRLEYRYSPGLASSRFLRAIAEGRITGQRCPSCEKVYVPPRGTCPRCAVVMDEPHDLPDTGAVTTFCIVNVPFAGQAVACPYVSAAVRIDGADSSIFHLVQEVDAADVRMGMRVRAVWVPPEERGPTLMSIRHFAPTGEPDVPIARLSGEA